MQQEIKNIKNKYFEIAERLKAPPSYVHFYDKPQNYNCCYVEYDNGIFFYIVMNERGGEVKRLSTNDPDKILYWHVNNLTFALASQYELDHRDDSQDHRRILFKHQIELLEKINKEWAEEQRLEYDKILLKRPYDDNINN